MLKPAIAILTFEQLENGNSMVTANDVADIFVPDVKLPDHFFLDPLVFGKKDILVPKWEIVSHFESLFRKKLSLLDEEKLLLVFLDDKKEVEEISVCATSKRTLWIQKEHKKYGNVFFSPGMGWENGRVIFEDESNYVTTVGETLFQIKLYDADRESIEIPLITHAPKCMKDELYFELLEDLMSIYEDIILDVNSNTSLSKGCDWEKDIDCLMRTLKHIQPKAETNLEKVETKKNYQKVRRFTSKTMYDLSCNPQGRVRTLEDRENYNIYEHRVIRQYVDKVEKLAKKKLRQLSAKWELLNIEADEIEDKINNAKDDFEKKLKDLWEILSEAIENREDMKESDSKKRALRGEHNNTIKEIVVSFNREPKLMVDIKDSIGDVWFNENKAEIIIKNNDNLYGYHNKGYVEMRTLAFKTKDIPFLFWMIKNEQQRRVNNDSIMLRYKIYYKDKCEGSSFMIHKLTIENSPVTEDEIWDCCVEYKDELKRFYRVMHFYSSIHIKDNSKANYEDVVRKERYDKESKYWKSILEKITKMKKQFAMIRDIRANGYESVHLTNLFANNPDYREAYNILKHVPDEFGDLSFYQKNKLQVIKSCNVFEYWCLVKILWIFIDEYKFFYVEDSQEEREVRRVLAKQRMKEQITEYFKQPDRDKEENFTLRRVDEDMELEIVLTYQGQLEAKDTVYRPDFMLTITLKDKGVVKTKKKYVMDAKYRDFDGQGVFAFHRLLYDVAAYKYLVSAKEDIDGSYILHSYLGNKKVLSGYPMTRMSYYYGVDSKAYLEGVKEQCGPEFAEEWSSINSFLDQKKGWDSYWDGHIGAVVLLPNCTIYFKTLIRMIMERFIDVDGDAEHEGNTDIHEPKVCWMCGSEKPVYIPSECTEYSGKGDQFKCTNPECDDFFMIKSYCATRGCNKRLFKHKYSADYRRDLQWNNLCPYCHGERSEN